MQNINFDPFTERITWQDIRRYAPVSQVRYFAYTFELALIFVAGHAMVATGGLALLQAMLSLLVLTALWMFMYRYLHNRWHRHCKVRIKKFADVNNFTYEESADWSGTADALSRGTARRLIRPNDRYIVSGKYAGYHFRLGLYSAVLGGRAREYTYWRPFLRINITPDIKSNLRETYVAQDDLPVDVEYKKECIIIYSAQWSFSMQRVAQSMPDLFAQAAYAVRKKKK
ncbi:MAG TPA: hypothetical protein VF733_01595 [Candidatus Saccharimonadales bacterium]